MGVYQKLKEMILESQFQIQMGKNYVNIQNYTKLKDIESTRIRVLLEENTIEIGGENLTIQKLVGNEVLIVGKIKVVEVFQNE